MKSPKHLPLNLKNSILLYQISLDYLTLQIEQFPLLKILSGQ
nr:MAG TPA: hypothetical protein [Caudoviricetes sp.]